MFMIACPINLNFGATLLGFAEGGEISSTSLEGKSRLVQELVTVDAQHEISRSSTFQVQC